MGEDYPFYHPSYVPPKRDMKQIRADYRVHLTKLGVYKTKKY
jgi:hypothetical protein